jgi:hypothetical protein
MARYCVCEIIGYDWYFKYVPALQSHVGESRPLYRIMQKTTNRQTYRFRLIVLSRRSPDPRDGQTSS